MRQAPSPHPDPDGGRHLFSRKTRQFLGRRLPCRAIVGVVGVTYLQIDPEKSAPMGPTLGGNTGVFHPFGIRRPHLRQAPFGPVDSAPAMVALDRLPAILEHELAVAFPHRRLLGAWLYGSHALNRNRADSDLDIAVLFDAPLEPVATFDAAARLASVMGVSVDLVDLRRAGGLLRVEAIQGGRPLMQPATEADFFATHALADHLSFAANRRAATAAMQEKFRAR